MSYVSNVRMFVRVFELGSMSAAAWDQRVSPAVASSRIAELEKHLGARLFNRTTRKLQPTEHGKVFYEGATKILETIEWAESAVADITNNPRGSIFVAAPLGVGRRFVAPYVPAFNALYPEIDVRLRLSDRKVDVTAEGLDVTFVLGRIEDSALKMRMIAECPRVLCAAPSYIAKHGHPKTGRELVDHKHDCLLLRFPGTNEPRWTLSGANGPESFEVSGPFESDDGDVLTEWALAGCGVVNKPVFEVIEHILSGALVPVAEETPPTPVHLACLYPHRRFQDSKIRLFIDFMVARCKDELRKRTLPSKKR
ncbi:MAG: LysR family transcriptional regulator [Hyphomicrobiales bacterium]|nr:MAG: LysR family transcriptional regulator [Hyphomicrobiales bacterium]